MTNADALSRLPLPDTEPDNDGTEVLDVFLTEIDKSPVRADEVKTFSRRDPVIGEIMDRFVSNSLPGRCEPEFKPYLTRQHELSVEDGCLLWGGRVVIPPQCREKVLEELHTCHPSIFRIKMLARGDVWWPNLNRDLEIMAHKCSLCQLHQKAPEKAPTHPWEWPRKP